MDTSNLELSTQALIAEAQRRGVEVGVLDAADNFIVLRRDGRTEYVKQATRTSADTYVSALLMENKAVTKLVLTAAGLRAPGGARYDHETEAAGDFARYAGRRIVVKPNATNFGEGVALLGADAGEAEYRAAVTAAFALDRTVLVEEFVEGREFRFLVIGGATRAVLDRPAHPYTRLLLACHPDRAVELAGIPGTVPPATAQPSGCRFHPRCPQAQADCAVAVPPLLALPEGRALACGHPEAALVQ